MYSTNVFTERATTLITNHPPEKVNLASLLISKSREDSISAQVNIGRGPCLLGNNLISSRLVKNMTAMFNLGTITGSERSPGRGNGNPLQFYCLQNSMDREAEQATVHGMAKSWT